jgi:hypothetical protein
LLCCFPCPSTLTLTLDHITSHCLAFKFYFCLSIRRCNEMTRFPPDPFYPSLPYYPRMFHIHMMLEISFPPTDQTKWCNYIRVTSRRVSSAKPNKISFHWGISGQTWDHKSYTHFWALVRSNRDFSQAFFYGCVSFYSLYLQP